MNTVLLRLCTLILSVALIGCNDQTHAPTTVDSLTATPLAQVQAEIGQGKPLLLEVGAESCSACVFMGRLLHQKQAQYPDILFRFIDLGQERHAARALKVNLIPTQIFIDAQGREQLRHLGAYSEAELDAVLGRLGWLPNTP